MRPIALRLTERPINRTVAQSIYSLQFTQPNCFHFANRPFPITPRRKMSTSPAQNGITAPNYRYIDIGVNLTDPVFRGSYHGKQAHPDDLDAVIQRAVQHGCKKFMVTGSDLVESTKAVELAKQYPGVCYATIGVHPCSAQTFTTHPTGATSLLSSLRSLALRASKSGHCVAFGEIGLDYDRLSLCPKDIQLAYFAAQLDLATELNQPLFLHSRAAAEDFEALLRPRLEKLPRRGVVHSFTGSVEEMQRVVEMGFHVGVNGCSLKTAENLEVVAAIPLGSLQLETDAPWCEIRASHAGFARYLKDDAEAPALPKAVKKERWSEGCLVKGRNEPCGIGLVAHVVARVKGLPVEEICEAAWRNSVGMFGFGVEEGGVVDMGT